jgi:hypothetical protein
LREQIALISLLLLWVSAAQAAVGGQDTSLDIIGSRTNNTSIIVPEGTEIGLDIVGSTVSNITIGYAERETRKSGDMDIGYLDKRNKATCRGERKDCGPCGEEKRYTTPWDDFTRPLCYPWSSYIPTRYNRPFIREDNIYKGSIPESLVLGRGKTYP